MIVLHTIKTPRVINSSLSCTHATQRHEALLSPDVAQLEGSFGADDGENFAVVRRNAQDPTEEKHECHREAVEDKYW